jgi:hypothetical protein
LPGHFQREPLRGASAREGAFIQTLKLRVLDAIHLPLSGAAYELRVGDLVRRGRTDEQGILTEPFIPVPGRCVLRWRLPSGTANEVPDDEQSDSEFDFERTLFLDHKATESKDRDEAARKRLHNLGYDTKDFALAVSQFQSDRGLESKPWFDQATFDELQRIHDEIDQ